MMMTLCSFGQKEYVKLTNGKGEILEIFNMNDQVSFRIKDHTWINGFIEKITESGFVVNGFPVSFDHIDKIVSRKFSKQRRTSGIILISSGIVLWGVGSAMAMDETASSFFSSSAGEESSSSGILAGLGAVITTSGVAVLLTKGRKVKPSYQWMRVTFLENDSEN